MITSRTDGSVTTKARMYELLCAGEFGNTLPNYFSLEEWVASGDRERYEWWGLRSRLAAGDRRMRLNIHRDEVPRLWASWFPDGGGNLSVMIDPWVTLRAEVWEADVAPFGLVVYYAAGYDPLDPWRGSFRRYGRQLGGLAARSLLETHLWPSDYADLRVTLDRYPGHVVEFSACSRAVGLIPHRNTVIWEVRLY